MTTETQLWMWFLFGGVLRPQRAKSLLFEWEKHGLTLQQVVNQLPARPPALGLTREEAAKLHVPQYLPSVTALRWNDPLYPQGLHDLSFKLQPALLFYSGEVTLLKHPIIYLAPGALDKAARELLQETVGMLIGESLLLAAFEESPQATILLEEISTSEGEVLLFARQGLEQQTVSEQEHTLLDTGQLLQITPLPPGTHTNPAWDPLLEQVASASAARCVFSGTQSPPEKLPATASILLTTTAIGSAQSHNIQTATNAAEVLTWLLDIPTPVAPSPQPATSIAAEPALEPPPTPEEMLRTLEKGGNVPEALRRRLLGKT